MWNPQTTIFQRRILRKAPFIQYLPVLVAPLLRVNRSQLNAMSLFQFFLKQIIFSKSINELFCFYVLLSTDEINVS